MSRNLLHEQILSSPQVKYWNMFISLTQGERKDSTHLKLKDLFPFELSKTLCTYLCIRCFSSKTPFCASGQFLKGLVFLIRTPYQELKKLRHYLELYLISPFHFLFSGQTFRDEIRKLQEALQNHCLREGKTPIYEPSDFFKFCCNAGAANVFNFILSCITSSCHSSERVILNQKHTVVFLYQLCVGYSQKFNFFKKVMV